MKGHTDRATINTRRPLTEGMIYCLRWLTKSPVRHRDLTNERKNQMRGLMDRGYALPGDEVDPKWKITDAGRKAVL